MVNIFHALLKNNELSDSFENFKVSNIRNVYICVLSSYYVGGGSKLTHSHDVTFHMCMHLVLN